MKSSLLFAVLVAVTFLGCSRNTDAPGKATSAVTPAASTDPSPSGSEAAPAATPVAQPDPAAVPPSTEPAGSLVRPHSPVLGRANAPVTLVEFLDPACEACRAYAPVVKQILFLYPDEVRVVVRFADFHAGSDQAIRLLHAARQQGKFEAVLAALFDGQEQWAAHHSPDIEQAWKIAAAAGLDVPRARRAATSAEADALLRQDSKDIFALQVSRTPAFFVNGKPLSEFGAEPLLQLVAAEVKAAKSP